MTRQLLAALCAALCAISMLSACGGGGGTDAASPPPVPPAPPPVTAGDAFFAAVMGLFGQDGEGEPAPLDDAAVTSSDATEPQAVQ